MHLGCFFLFVSFLALPNLVMTGARKYMHNLRNSLVTLTFQEKRGTLINMH